MADPQPRRRLLLVEDDAIVGETITFMLEDDYEIILAITVSSALAHLSNADGPPIEVILLDCLLPDGKVTDILAAADRDSIPVVLTSGDPRQGDRFAAARRFLAKPFSQAALLMVLDSARR